MEKFVRTLGCGLKIRMTYAECWVPRYFAFAISFSPNNNLVLRNHFQEGMIYLCIHTCT